MPTVKPGVIFKLSPTVGILGCINEHDGSGYLHALLEAFHPGYARLRSDHYRTHLAKSVRIGAVPFVLRARYGADPLCTEGCADARMQFNKAMAFGSDLPEVLLKNYAEFLRVPYQLHDANLKVIDEYFPPGKNTTPCHIIMTTEDEYHLLVRLIPSAKGDVIKFRVLDSAIK
jgi:hypothetical protein